MEVDKIQILLGMANTSPSLFADLTNSVMYKLRNVEYYQGQIKYEDSTLGGLTEGLLRIWQAFPEKYRGRMAEIKGILEYISLVRSNGAQSAVVKPAMDQLQAVIQEKLSV